jgi:Zn-dependent protease
MRGAEGLAVTDTEAVPMNPEPVFNCPSCSHWLAPGTVACPDCGTLAYGRHVAKVARAAIALEGEDKWGEAREMWHSALAWLPEGSDEAAQVQGRIQAIDSRKQAAEEQKAKWTKRLGPLAPAGLFLLKAKTFLFALFKFKFLLSFVAFFGLYWALFGWRFGLGFTLLILIHELGHYIAARRRGLKADLPVFLPGLGAYVKWYSMGIGLDDLAAIALAGPTMGLLSAVICLGIYFTTKSPVFGALAHVAAWLNLINLIPVLGLDGAQATYALDRTQRVLIFVTCVVLFVLLKENAYLLVAAGMLWRVFKRDGPEQPSTRTMVGFMTLLMVLGAIVWVAPDLGSR